MSGDFAIYPPVVYLNFDDIEGVLSVENGGTGNTFLIGNQLMISNSSATEIVEAGALTNGQLFIGSSGNAPQAANITPGTGISVTNGAGSISVGLQNVTGVLTGIFPTAFASDPVGYPSTTLSNFLAGTGTVTSIGNVATWTFSFRADVTIGNRICYFTVPNTIRASSFANITDAMGFASGTEVQPTTPFSSLVGRITAVPSTNVIYCAFDPDTVTSQLMIVVSVTILTS